MKFVVKMANGDVRIDEWSGGAVEGARRIEEKYRRQGFSVLYCKPVGLDGAGAEPKGPGADRAGEGGSVPDVVETVDSLSATVVEVGGASPADVGDGEDSETDYGRDPYAEDDLGDGAAGEEDEDEEEGSED